MFVTERSWTPTARELPRKDSRVEWIAPSGAHERGTFAGGAVWFPEGSTMYVYYAPTYWRYLDATEAQPR